MDQTRLQRSGFLVKDSIFLINILLVVYICQLKKKITPLFPKGMNLHVKAAVVNLQRMSNKIQKSGATAKVRISEEQVIL